MSSAYAERAFVGQSTASGGAGCSEHRAHTDIKAPTAAILDVLLDTRAVDRWFAFTCRFDAGVARLQPGQRYRATGSLAGVTLNSVLDVHHADAQRIALRLDGLVIIELDLTMQVLSSGQMYLDARVRVQPGPGATGRMLASISARVLRRGALTRALAAIRAEAESAPVARLTRVAAM